MWTVFLGYIKSLGPNSTLSDKMLTLKLAMLLALASAGRTSELSALDIRYMTNTSEDIVLKLAKLTKSRKNGQSPISLRFESFPSNKGLPGYVLSLHLEIIYNVHKLGGKEVIL